MNNISSTLNCKNIIKDRINKKLPIYNFGLGENKLLQPDFFVQNLKKYSNKKEYVSGDGIEDLQKIFIH